jgi:hypothetical protein
MLRVRSSPNRIAVDAWSAKPCGLTNIRTRVAVRSIPDRHHHIRGSWRLRSGFLPPILPEEPCGSPDWRPRVLHALLSFRSRATEMKAALWFSRLNLLHALRRGSVFRPSPRFPANCLAASTGPRLLPKPSTGRLSANAIAVRFLLGLARPRHPCERFGRWAEIPLSFLPASIVKCSPVLSRFLSGPSVPASRNGYPGSASFGETAQSAFKIRSLARPSSALEPSHPLIGLRLVLRQTHFVWV